LTSLCQQISLHHNLPLDPIPSDLTPLVSHFKSLIWRVATPRTPLVIFLDSLDMLSPADGAHQLAWFTTSLPADCKLVASVVRSYYGILERLESLIEVKDRVLIEVKDRYVHVDSLGTELGVEVLRAWLAKAGRTVTPHQWTVVQAAIEK
jgi:hypothetical protein